MKKIRKAKVLIAMLTITVFMGAAYAAWTDQLVVNGTVATGEVMYSLWKMTRLSHYRSSGVAKRQFYDQH